MTELGALLGSPQRSQDELVEPEVATEAPVVSEVLISEALRNRPELAALRLEYDAARRFAEAESRLSLPTVSAAGFAGGAPVHATRLNPRYGAAGVLVNIPVFNGRLFEAQLRLQAAERRLREMENSIRREAAIAALSADTAYQKVLLLRQAARATATDEEKEKAETRLAHARYDYHLLRATIDFQLGRLR
jgi:outer membrane protein TolC